jgi:hypothetical protein
MLKMDKHMSIYAMQNATGLIRDFYFKKVHGTIYNTVHLFVSEPIDQRFKIRSLY